MRLARSLPNLINLGDLLLDLHGSNLAAGGFSKNFDVAESKGYVSRNHTILETPKARASSSSRATKCKLTPENAAALTKYACIGWPNPPNS